MKSDWKRSAPTVLESIHKAVMSHESVKAFLSFLKCRAGFRAFDFFILFSEEGSSPNMFLLLFYIYFIKIRYCPALWSVAADPLTAARQATFSAF